MATNPLVNPKRAMLYGPQMLQATESKRQAQRKADRWPYEWVYPPPASKQDQAVGFLAVPLAGTPSLVCAYRVPDSLEFYPTELVFDVVGGTPGWLPGDFTWSLTINSPVNVPAPQTLPYDGYTNVPFSLGSLVIPWKLPQGERNKAHSQDLLQLVVTNVNLGVGSGLIFVGVIKGYVIPSAG